MTTQQQPRCRCGADRDERGLCRHCDYRGATACKPSCPRCEQRDKHCEVCWAFCGTPQAARHHRDNCRRAEMEAARRRNDQQP